MHPVTDTLSQILHDADVRVAFAKADILDGLLVRLRRVVVEDIGRDARAQLEPAPAFSPQALAAMEALDAAAGPPPTPAPTIDPLADTAPAAQPNPTPAAADPLDAPRSRGRRRRGETVGAPATPIEAAPAPERDALPGALPEPDALDLPGEPVGDDVAVAAPAPDVALEVALPASLDDIFGAPPAEYDPLGD